MIDQRGHPVEDVQASWTVRLFTFVVTLDGLAGGRPAGELWGWIRLLSLYDVVFLALATLLFPVVVDE